MFFRIKRNYLGLSCRQWKWFYGSRSVRIPSAVELCLKHWGTVMPSAHSSMMPPLTHTPACAPSLSPPTCERCNLLCLWCDREKSSDLKHSGYCCRMKGELKHPSSSHKAKKAIEESKEDEGRRFLSNYPLQVCFGLGFFKGVKI